MFLFIVYKYTYLLHTKQPAVNIFGKHFKLYKSVI